MLVVFFYFEVSVVLKDCRFGCEVFVELVIEFVFYMVLFYKIEVYLMLELEFLCYMCLCGLVMCVFMLWCIKMLVFDIIELMYQLIDQFFEGEFDFLFVFVIYIFVVIICCLLGVLEFMVDQLLKWFNVMVLMYMVSCMYEIELVVVQVLIEFVEFICFYVDEKCVMSGDDLLMELIVVEEDGEKLLIDEFIIICILFLNVGYEVMVYIFGNVIKCLLEYDMDYCFFFEDKIDVIVEEFICFDLFLYMFMCYVYEDIEVVGQMFKCGDQIVFFLGVVNRDLVVWENFEIFDLFCLIKINMVFGVGLYFCVGVFLVWFELKIVLLILFECCLNFVLV